MAVASWSIAFECGALGKYAHDCGLRSIEADEAAGFLLFLDLSKYCKRNLCLTFGDCLRGVRMMQSVIAGTTSTVLAAGILALAGYFARKRLLRMFKGMDILSSADAPYLELSDRNFAADVGLNKTTAFMLENTGNVSLRNIRIYRCYSPNAGQSAGFRIVALPFESRFWSIERGSGERVQIEVPSRFFSSDEQYPDYRIFVEATDSLGTVYRGTAIRSSGTGFGMGGMRRVRKSLPRRGLVATTGKRVSNLVGKYDLDLSVG